MPATLAATRQLARQAYTEAIASDEVETALETVNGSGHSEMITDEPGDGQVLVAGVLYDTDTLEEADAG